jgi:hypothetical protein
MSTTATLEDKPKVKKRDAQRFLQTDIPTLLDAYASGNTSAEGLEAAFAAFPNFDQKVVKLKLIKLGKLDSSRPQLNDKDRTAVGSIASDALDMLIGKFGASGKVPAVYVRGLISALKGTLKSETADEETEDAA